ncbi:MAG: diadenylate cyclase CdaA [Phycisphaerae bacterium]
MIETTAILADVDFSDTIRNLLNRALDNPLVSVVEFLLIGTVIYAALRCLQGTRGARLIRAVLTILAVSFAVVRLMAAQLRFERINALYPYFLLGVFLVSLVAFQTELRRLLLRLGEGGWLDYWIKEPPSTVDPIVRAVERLAKRKVGALIAIERTTEVGAVLESGVRLDAHVSAELIETIFQPGTPLHDLGVIVRGDRLLAAGCQFPLAESDEVDRSLGSRHRAGVGMSHEADAVVIIVSEETGAISLAVRGILQRAVTPDKLRSRLISELTAGRIDDQNAHGEPERNAAAPPDEKAEGDVKQSLALGKAADGTSQTA